MTTSEGPKIYAWGKKRGGGGGGKGGSRVMHDAVLESDFTLSLPRFHH